MASYSFTRNESGLLLSKDRAVEKESSINFSMITLNKEVEVLCGSFFDVRPEMSAKSKPETENEIESNYQNAQAILDNLGSRVESRA